MFEINEKTLNEIKRLSKSYSLSDIENAVFLDFYKKSHYELRTKIDLLLRTEGVINVMNSIDLLKSLRKGN